MDCRNAQADAMHDGTHPLLKSVVDEPDVVAERKEI